MRRDLVVRTLLVGVSLAALSGCWEDDETPPASPTVSELADAGRASIECYARFNGLEDCDRDGVANAADVIPGRDDLADDDGDTVPNKLDRYPGSDDRTFDMDRDGLADFQDTFLGNNNEDADRDGLANGIDLQPYAAPPGGAAVLPPAGVTNQQLVNEMLSRQMTRKYDAKLLGPNPDADLDGIPDENDLSPTVFTNDRDGDGDYDYYDPEPGDANLYSRNDPWDTRNDEYWED